MSKIDPTRKKAIGQQRYILVHTMGQLFFPSSSADAPAKQKRQRPATSFLLAVAFFCMIINHVSGQQCGIQVGGAVCPYSWAPCCSQNGRCGSTSEYCGFGCQSGCTGVTGGYNYNYCGTSWNDAYAKCGTSCPCGVDSECPAGEKCYADCSGCPAAPVGVCGVAGSSPPPPAVATPPPPPASGTGLVVGSNYNYCGNGWEDAFATCAQSCPLGTNGECPTGETCYANMYSCPAVPVYALPPPPPPLSGVPPGAVPPPPGPASPEATADYPDSRLVAYVGNWQACPTAAQTDAYTHLMIGFAVTYMWEPGNNRCDTACTLPATVNICNNHINQNLVDTWREQGKKVLLSFGGAGMGGSWASSGDNCWDYCFGKEEYLSAALVNIVKNQKLDGIDIDYEYCYDKTNDRHEGCGQTTSLYSDQNAQTFLSELTRLLREKLNVAAPAGTTYELTHAPMDTDLTPGSPYYKILKAQSANLDFIMPQFYNGITRPVRDGFDEDGSLTVSTASVYTNLVTDMFDGEAEKVVFGFCIDDCGGTGSNASGSQAVTVLKQVKQYNTKEFECNGGAMFWVAAKDYSGSWSDPVWAEIQKTSGCSDGRTPPPTDSPVITPPPTPPPTHSPVIPLPTKQPTNRPVSPTDPTFSTCGPDCVSALSDVSALYPLANCIGFYMCWDGQVLGSTICTYGELFDVDKELCVASADVNCRCTETVTPGPPPPDPAVSPPADPVVLPPSPCPTANWDIIGSADCKGYYFCTNGVIGEFIPCPSGQLFQVRFKGCDWEGTVNCGQSINPPPPPPPLSLSSSNQISITASNPNLVQSNQLSSTTSVGSVWYPDWARSNTCQNDGQQPSWMNTLPGYYHYTQKECCDEWYWWTRSCY